MTHRRTCLGLLLALTACSGGGSGGGSPSAAPGAATTNTTVGLTDAPSDDLSVLQVEITDLSVEDGAGARTSIFPGTGGASVTVNLLRLRGFSRLLTALALPTGSYDRLVLTYRGATGVDTAGNALSVTPSSGTAIGTFAPTFTVSTGSNRYVEVDFDVDASVANLTLGAGGSLQLQPVLVLKVEDSGATRSLEDFKARVQAVGATTLDVSLGAGTLRVVLNNATQIVAGGQVSTLAGASLPGLIAVGSIVEVRGAYDVSAKVVRATAVELEDGLGVSGSGPSLDGLVVGLGGQQVTVLVLDPRDSGAQAGSTRVVGLDASTRFAYDGFPTAAASAASLALGQEVRVFGASQATGVRLRDTRLEGRVTAVDAGQRQLTVEATSFERVAISRISGFTNPVTVQLDGPLPAAAAVGAAIELEGQFQRTAVGVFDVPSAAVQPEANQDQLEGLQFTLLSANPLRIELTGDGGPLGNPLTVTVIPANGATLVERDQAGVTTPTSAADLAAGIAAGRYDELRAKGTYDASSGILTATSIRADVR